MKDILKNKWIKLVASVISGVYAYFIIWFAVNSFLYRCVVTNIVEFGFFYIIMNLAFLAVMLYSRKQIITTIVSLLLLPFVFFILIMNLNNLIVFIPAFIVCVIMFFACKSNGSIKTLLGTVYLLLYILGVIAFLVVRLLFGSSVDETKLDNDALKNNEIKALYSEDTINRLTNDYVSSDGKYRFYAVDVEDKALGRVDVFVEVADSDKIYSSFSFLNASCKRKISYHSGRGDESVPQLKWVSNDTIQYQYPNDEVKTTKIQEIKKDYFWFLYE